MKPLAMKLKLEQLLVTAALALGVTAAAAQTFPNKPVRIVVNTGSGGLTDLTARIVGQKMAEKLGQPVVIENRGGADGVIGSRYVKSSPADGYTILATASSVAIQPTVKLDPGYDLTKDFTGVGMMVRSPLLMVAAPNEPAKTLAEYVARAKANPNKMSYASAGTGTTTHVAAAIVLQNQQVELIHVPYKGNGAALPDVLGGRVGMLMEAYAVAAPYIKSGALKAYGVTSASRLAALPEVPTFKELGVSQSYTLWLGLLAPAGTPKEAIQKLSEALHYATSSPELSERFRAEGSETSNMSPEEFNELLRKEVAQMSKLMADLKVEKQ